MKTWKTGLFILGIGIHSTSAQIPVSQISREEIRATALYLSEVTAAIYQQRQHLTPLISSDDQQKLTAYHERARQRAVDQRTASPLLQEYVRKQNRQMEMQDWSMLQPLVMKYTSACQQLTSKLTPQQQQWHTELTAIHRRYLAGGHICTATEQIPSLGLVDWMLTPAGFLTIQLPGK